MAKNSTQRSLTFQNTIYRTNLQRRHGLAKIKGRKCKLTLFLLIRFRITICAK